MTVTGQRACTLTGRDIRSLSGRTLASKGLVLPICDREWSGGNGGNWTGNKREILAGYLPAFNILAGRGLTGCASAC
jgi:hypothetical protein